jgi:CBS domain containing-hemolysin-like protein
MVFVLAGLGLGALLFLSSAFSGSETAFFSLSRLELEELDPKGRVRRLMRDPERLLISILLGNTLVNVAAGSLGALIALEFGRARGYPEAATIALEVGVVTFVILVLGEVAPKMHAMQRNVAVAKRTAPIVLAVDRALRPVISALDAMVSRMQGRLGSDERPFVTAEELRTIVAISEQRGTLEEDERDMIDSVMEFGETVVREVMVPRVDMECFEDVTRVGDAIARIRELGLSRYPVYHGDLDHIDGILYAKDLLKLDAETEIGREVGELIRPAHFTPETKKAGELLRELQRRRIHITIVVDEYGGTAGLVTLEDLIEEIVGEIRDEYDVEQQLVTVIDRSTVIADGMVRLEDLEEEIEVDLEVDGVETLGGLLMNAFGRIPSEGEKLERQGLVFTIESVEEQRIVRVRIDGLGDDDETQPTGS